MNNRYQPKKAGRRSRVALGVASVGAVAVLAACAGTSSGSSAAPSGSSSTGASASSVSDIVAKATASIEKHTGPQTEWTGPTTGPTIDGGKNIVVIGSNLSNNAVEEYSKEIEGAGKAVGWNITVLDGKGTQSGWVSAFNAAISRKPDGIITDTSADALKTQLSEAAAQNIPVVGIHAAAFPKAYPDQHLFFNEESNPQELGSAIADYAIADSKGKARVVILYDAEYAIARAKAEAIKAEIEKCSTCKLLAYVNSPIADEQTDIPPLATKWWSQYGKGTYILTIADTYFDYMVPALKSAGVPPDGLKLVGSDGTPTAYQRVRTGSYEIATVPEPWGLFGYQAIDELNRAFHNAAPSLYTPPVYIVNKANIDTQGGKQDKFEPQNNYRQHYLKIWNK